MFSSKTDSSHAVIQIPHAVHNSIEVVLKWESSILEQVIKLVTCESFHWFVHFFPIFKTKVTQDDHLSKLPKLVRFFHQSGQSIFYEPHRQKLVYQSEPEDVFPVLKSLREAMCELFDYQFNFTGIINYPSHEAHINRHNDGSQIFGTSNTKGLKGQEFIISLALLGNKITSIHLNDSNDTIYIMHKRGSIYCMDGIQRMTTHAKLGIKLSHSRFSKYWPKQCALDGSHIVVVFRRLKPSNHNIDAACIRSKVNVTWNNKKTICFFKQEPKAESYQGIREYEPIGYHWTDINAMRHFGAHPVTSGIHSNNGIVYSVIDNSSTNTYLTSNAIIYSGHGMNNNIIERSNNSLFLTSKEGIGFRYYIGSKSLHSQAPQSGYVFLSLMFILRCWIEINTRKRKRQEDRQCDQIFKVLLKPTKPSDTVLKTLQDVPTLLNSASFIK
jgi:hypothetical protein